jgi:hypothetical protein
MDESAIIDDLVLWLIETYDVAEVSVDGNDAEGVVLRVSIKVPSAAAGDPLPPRRPLHPRLRSPGRRMTDKTTSCVGKRTDELRGVRHDGAQ